MYFTFEYDTINTFFNLSLYRVIDPQHVFTMTRFVNCCLSRSPKRLIGSRPVHLGK